jgi:hypothetical protein
MARTGRLFDREADQQRGLLTRYVSSYKETEYKGKDREESTSKMNRIMFCTLRAGIDIVLASGVGPDTADWLSSTHKMQLCCGIYYFK